MSFNPFELGEFEELTSRHLQLLVENGVAEGYFIEYKQEPPPKAKAIAKSIASLANTYGGWYIIGVVTDDNNVANGIPGFSREKMRDPQMAIRDVCISGISPSPHMKIHVVELSNQNLVAAIFVPAGQHTPFICTDGRVYRRNQDSSEPVYENDRLSFDQIVKRGKKNDKEFDAFCKENRTFSKAEEDGWVSIYLAPYPDKSILIKKLFEASWMEDLISRSQKPLGIMESEHGSITGNLPFDNVMRVGNSIVLRQVNESELYLNKLSMSIDLMGRAKIRIPLNARYFAELKAFDENILRHIANHNTDMTMHLRFIDMGMVWLNAMSLLAFYSDIVKEFGVLGDFRYRVSANRLWRTVPLVNCAKWIEYSDIHGFPVNMQATVDFPEYTQGGEIANAESKYWFLICAQISNILGLHESVFFDTFGEIILSAASGTK